MIPPMSNGLHAELVANVPMRCHGMSYLTWTDGIAFIDSYLTAAEQCLSRHKESADDLKDLLPQLDHALLEVRSWRNSQWFDGNMHELSAAITTLHDNASPIIARLLDAAIREVCAGMSKALMTSFLNVASLASVPVSDQLMPVIIEEESTSTVSFEGNSVTINSEYLIKLRELFRVHAGQDRMGEFPRALFAVARRYATFIGSEHEGAGFHGALPDAVFKVLAEDFHVCQEAFASPFNCYFSKYSSAFWDIDGWFGSQGSFFQYAPSQGSFEVNPPFTAEAMYSCVTTIHTLLRASTGPMSFVVILPSRRQPLLPALKILDESTYLQWHVVMEGGQHSFLSGLQHVAVGRDWLRYYTPPYGTEIHILQNDQAAKCWPVTQDKMDRLIAAFQQQYI